jgi:CTP synthase
VGRDNVLYIHVTLLPHIGSTEELKTKPTQHSVMALRGVGISADVIICRADMPIPPSIREKVAFFADVDADAVIPLETVDTIYEVPLVLEEAGLGNYLVKRFNLSTQEPDLHDWRALVHTIKQPRRALPIALVGKYVDLKDAYISVAESLRHAGLHQGLDIDIRWVSSEQVERDGAEELLSDVYGIVVPGGFGYRGVEGKILAADYARRFGVPYLGLCLGMQCATIAFARWVMGSNAANSTEVDPHTPFPVIDFMPDQLDVSEKGGTMRLGVYPCVLVPGTKAHAAYGTEMVLERHRHRLEFNNAYRKMLEDAGLVVSGHSPDGRLVEIIELRDHPWFVGSQFHPEFLSRPNRPHPLFREFCAAAAHTFREGDQRPLPLEEGAVRSEMRTWATVEA